MESRHSLEVTRDNTGDEGEFTHTHTHSHSHTHTLTVIISGGFHQTILLENAFWAYGSISLAGLFVAE